MKPATLLETWKTLLTVLLEHDKFREEHFQHRTNTPSETAFIIMKVRPALIYIYILYIYNTVVAHSFRVRFVFVKKKTFFFTN